MALQLERCVDATVAHLFVGITKPLLSYPLPLPDGASLLPLLPRPTGEGLLLPLLSAELPLDEADSELSTTCMDSDSTHDSGSDTLAAADAAEAPPSGRWLGDSSGLLVLRDVSLCDTRLQQLEHLPEVLTVMGAAATLDKWGKIA